MRKKPNYGEGDWFTVPLRTGGFGLGVVARASPSGILLGYFFGPRNQAQPTRDSYAGLTPKDAVLVARFGDLGLKQGEWLVIGGDADWDREKWPVPVFRRSEQLSGRTYQVFYDDSDPGLLIREEQISADSPTTGPSDSLFGAGAVEKALTRILS